MDKPIAVGDLVMIVRGHPCSVRQLGGMIWTVLAIHPPIHGGWKCYVCGEELIAPTELGAQLRPGTINGTPLSWLKRIDPPSEQESVTSDEEVKA